MRKPGWMFSYDTESCKDLFNAISGYNMGIQTKDDVKAIVDKYHITEFDNYKESIKKVLNDLFPPFVPINKRHKGKRADIELEENVSEETLEETPVEIDENISEEGISE